MALQVLVVDDEPLARARLRALLADCREPEAVAAAEAGTAAQALALAQHQRFDVALLDIHMPGADGMQLACALRALPEPPRVVFVTAHAEHAVRAFEIDAVDYLTKPVRLERLQAALQKTQRVAQLQSAPEPDSAPDWLLITERHRTLRVPLAEVLYLKAELKYITVRTREREYLIEESLTSLEEEFIDRFVRIHRNALVARERIERLQRTPLGHFQLFLKGLNGDALIVSRRHVAGVRKLMQQL